ncbi:hypothetical protein SAMN05421538_106197 [Paracoccus isoporae]|uniref:Copper(I)-binding protein n=1 Tax=Paracoccus isoporae TaxID=591205 RepID=A0A1G7CSW6_9RHOB|nr:copper chaperone PCu(A)C [Paracoccus isoporae]SDE42343.1 hypothetical protein SAMN05421538_106197 [Paracoccus isoporae]
MTTKILTALMALALPTAALAQAGDLQITDSFARSSNPRTGAAYLTIHNAGPEACTLSAVTTPITDNAELHTSREDADGLMQMVPLEDGITIAAGADHMLARGGDHIMLMGLAEPLAEGDEVALTLDFGTCGTVETVAPVDNARMSGADTAAAHGSGMDH